MKLLLDTHIVLWAFSDAGRLSGAIREVLKADDALIFVSLATLWELRIKETIGKITLPKSFYTALEPAGYELLPIRASHIHEYGLLPMIHRDPFDRMLVAQARAEQLRLATSDRRLEQYGVSLLV